VQEWASLETCGFPGYEISNDGLVRNERTEKMLRMSPNSEGILRVGIMKRDEGRQMTVSVCRLVAVMFLPGRSKTFDTPIQLNGDRTDCRVENLAWRPRWFAVKYFNQFDRTDPLFTSRIYDIETSQQYADSREAATKHGLLETAILDSVVNRSPCFPTWQQFAHVEH
jgi:hypothetical protein